MVHLQVPRPVMRSTRPTSTSTAHCCSTGRVTQRCHPPTPCHPRPRLRACCPLHPPTASRPVPCSHQVQLALAHRSTTPSSREDPWHLLAAPTCCHPPHHHITTACHRPRRHTTAWACHHPHLHTMVACPHLLQHILGCCHRQAMACTCLPLRPTTTACTEQRYWKACKVKVLDEMYGVEKALKVELDEWELVEWGSVSLPCFDLRRFSVANWI